MVKSRDEKYPRVVFCDMTRANLITVEASEVTSTASKLRSGVNFINILHEAFMCVDTSSPKITVKSWAILHFWDLRA